MRRPANHVKLKVEEYQAYEKLIPELRTKPVPICLDEWAYSGGPPNSYRVVPAYAWTLHEMFRHSDLYQMACFTFATAMFSSNRSEATLNPTGLMFKTYREHFGSIPVAVSGNSPQPLPMDPAGGEQPAVNAGSDTFRPRATSSSTFTLRVRLWQEPENSIAWPPKVSTLLPKSAVRQKFKFRSCRFRLFRLQLRCRNTVSASMS
jgi:alpha-N-arabinofuranosidase